MEEQRNNQVVQPITEQTLPNQLTPVSVQQQTPPQVIAPDTIPPKKKSKLWLWIILVIILVLVGVGGWFYYAKGQAMLLVKDIFINCSTSSLRKK